MSKKFLVILGMTVAIVYESTSLIHAQTCTPISQNPPIVQGISPSVWSSLSAAWNAAAPNSGLCTNSVTAWPAGMFIENVLQTAQLTPESFGTQFNQALTSLCTFINSNFLKSQV